MTTWDNGISHFTLSICVPSLFAWFKIARGIRINWEIGDGVVTFLIGFVFSITLVMIYYSIIMGDIEREILESPFPMIIFTIEIPIFIFGVIGISIIFLDGYGSGLLFVLSFVVAMEVLYLFSAPWLPSEINEFVCEALKIPPESC